MRTVGNALLSAALTALSVAMFFIGYPVLGMVGVLLFGVGGVVYFLITRPAGARASRSRPQAAVTRHGRLPGMPRFTTESAGMVFPGSRVGTLITAVGALSFVVAGLGLMYLALYLPQTWTRGGPVVPFFAGLLGVGCFGLIGALAVRAFVLGGNGIVLVADGVYFRAPAGRAWVRWDDLTSVRVGDGIQFLAHSPERIALTGLNRWLHGINRREFGMDVGYPIMDLKSDPGAVVEWINHYRANAADRRQLRYSTSVRD